MENKDIHNGLDKKEIRDFLAKMRIKEGSSCNYMPLEVISTLEKQIIHNQEVILNIKAYSAINELIKSCGWNTFDVSNDISKYDPKTYFEFIGTDEEFKTLEKKVKKE